MYLDGTVVGLARAKLTKGGCNCEMGVNITYSEQNLEWLVTCANCKMPVIVTRKELDKDLA